MFVCPLQGTRRRGTLVVINMFILLLGLILVTSKCGGMLGQREYVALGISMILCSTADLVPTSVCLSFGASGFKFGSWVDVVTSADDKILCQIVVCLWGIGRGPHGQRL